jgi:hypothetical protein
VKPRWDENLPIWAELLLLILTVAVFTGFWIILAAFLEPPP